MVMKMVEATFQDVWDIVSYIRHHKLNLYIFNPSKRTIILKDGNNALKFPSDVILKKFICRKNKITTLFF